MKLSIESLKLQFKQYLIQQGIEPELNDNEELSGASIFTYELEFKDFIEENFKINIDDLSFNIDDLLEMDMEDGQFVMPEDENEEEITQDELMLTVLNTLLTDEDFTKNLDETHDGKLDTDEIKKFLTYSNEQDDDDKILTFADMALGTIDAQKGDYKPKEVDLNTQETKETKETPKVQSSGGGGSYSYSGSSSSSSSSKKEEVQKNPYSGESVDSLKAKEQEEQNNYDIAKEEVLSIQNGTHSELQTLEQGIENSQKDFIDAMKAHSEEGKKLAEQLDEMLTQSRELSAQQLATQQELTLTQQEITAQGQIVTDSENRISNLNELKSGLNAKLSSLTSEQIEERSSISLQITQLEEQITQEEKRRDDAQKKKDELETTTKPKLEETIAKNNEAIQELNTKSQEIITQTNELLLNNPELDALSELYNKAQDDYNAKKTELLNLAQTNLTTSQTNLQNIREELVVANNREDKNMAKTNLGGDIFKEQGGKYTWEEVIGQTNLNYGIISPENVDENEQLPVIVFLHGMGQNNPSGLSATKTVILNDIFTSRDGTRTYDLEDFNGYIICPHSESGWYNQAGNIDEVLNDFSNTHNIDPDNIVLMGHSSGGSGVIYTLDSETFKDDEGFKFKKGVALAGYPDWMKDDDAKMDAEKHFDLAAPLIVYADDGTKKADFDKYVSNVEQWINWNGENHNYLDQRAFSEDLDGDGRADMLELVFEEEN